MNLRPQIDDFLSSSKIAIAGVSRNKNKFGNNVYRELKKKGFNVLPLNPNCDLIEGDRCYHTISALPSDVEALLCVMKPDITEKVLDQAVKGQIKKIWIQQGAESEKAITLCQEQGITPVTKSCIMMYAGPVDSIHKFHRGIAKLFKSYHKPL